MILFRTKHSWKFISLLAFILMIVGFLVSLWGINHNNINLSIIGMVAIIGVSVSWWLWVVIIVTHMFNHFEDTTVNLLEIKQDIAKVKELVNQSESLFK